MKFENLKFVDGVASITFPSYDYEMRFTKQDNGEYTVKQYANSSAVVDYYGDDDEEPNLRTVRKDCIAEDIDIYINNMVENFEEDPVETASL